MIIGRERRNPITNNITKKKNSKDNSHILIFLLIIIKYKSILEIE